MVENVPALKYITHVSLFKSHNFYFPFPAYMSGNAIAKSPGPMGFFHFSFTTSLPKLLKGKLHRLAVVAGVGLAAAWRYLWDVTEGRSGGPTGQLGQQQQEGTI